jgi:hypothetical protein
MTSEVIQSSRTRKEPLAADIEKLLSCEVAEMTRKDEEQKIHHRNENQRDKQEKSLHFKLLVA